MGYMIEHNCLLVFYEKEFAELKKEEGAQFRVVKAGSRLYPLNIPFEFCNKDYQYIGKLLVEKIIIEKDQTTLEGKILKIFSDEESAVFTKNFIKP